MSSGLASRPQQPSLQGREGGRARLDQLGGGPHADCRWVSLQGKRLWAYAQGKLRNGYPRRIEEEFPGVPGDLDAAVECHPKECASQTVLFFKGEEGERAHRGRGGGREGGGALLGLDGVGWGGGLLATWGTLVGGTPGQVVRGLGGMS